MVDPVSLASELIKCPSVTPEDAGVQELVKKILEERGFKSHSLPFQSPGEPKINNLFICYQAGEPPFEKHFSFAGHTDVVPAGRKDSWSVDPFGGVVRDGFLWGRGASDMKGAVAAFIAAASNLTESWRKNPPTRSFMVSLMITGDEEAKGIDGTVKILEWAKNHQLTPHHCLVGEPTNPKKLGEMMKIGRRGNLLVELKVKGIQGHAAYPERADNPIPKLLKILAAIKIGPIDDGTEQFQPSNLELTAVETNNPATNIIPGEAIARFTIRFNNLHSCESLERGLREKFDSLKIDYEMKTHHFGESFLTPRGPLSSLVAQNIERVTGIKPDLSTTGGTSDARYISSHCPVVEFGLVGATMHQVDERVSVEDLTNLTKIYEGLLNDYFSQ